MSNHNRTSRLAFWTMTLLASLTRSNLGILRQKLGLVDALVTKHGAEQAKAVFQTSCPIVQGKLCSPTHRSVLQILSLTNPITLQATIGQHVRHSMDHLERAAFSGTDTEIHYDLRVRGGSDEHDMDAAVDRIRKVQAQLEQLAATQSADGSDPTTRVVNACFMLSGDSEKEFKLKSTFARELGFAAHHALHHLAMVRVIALQTGGLLSTDLPSDFGRAPSTVNHDH